MVLRIALSMLIGLSVLALGGIGFVALRPTQPPTAMPTPPRTIKALVAARPVRAGTLLVPEDLAAKEIVQADMPAGAYPDAAEARLKLRGAMVRRSLDKDQPIVDADVLHPGDHGFLAAVLAPGTRAVSVAVDAVSGTAGLIWPGDHVDLILTQSMEDRERSPGQRVAGETVLSDLRVIAVDQQLMQGGQPSVGPQSTARTVTLEVTQAQAERVAVSVRLGHLSLVVRSADQANGSAVPDVAARPPAPGIVWAGDVSAALRAATGSPGAAVRVHQGKEQPVEFKF